MQNTLSCNILWQSLSRLSKIQSYLSNLFPFLASSLLMRGRQSPDIFWWRAIVITCSSCSHNNQLYLATLFFSFCLVQSEDFKLYLCEASKITAHSSSSYQRRGKGCIISLYIELWKNNEKNTRLLWSSLSLALYIEYDPDIEKCNQHEIHH